VITDNNVNFYNDHNRSGFVLMKHRYKKGEWTKVIKYDVTLLRDSDVSSHNQEAKHKNVEARPGTFAASRRDFCLKAYITAYMTCLRIPNKAIYSLKGTRTACRQNIRHFGSAVGEDYWRIGSKVYSHVSDYKTSF